MHSLYVDSSLEKTVLHQGIFQFLVSDMGIDNKNHVQAQINLLTVS